MPCRIGLMGGTFDPVHHGHLYIAEAARETFALEQVLFIPVGNPPHKQHRRITPARDRLSMLSLAVAGNPWFSVSALETDRRGPTYTVDTLTALQAESPDAVYYYIIGADTLLEVQNWKSFDQVAGLCRFIVLHRPGVPRPQAQAEGEALRRTYGAQIEWMESLLLEISSQDIRQRTAQNRSIRYLVPEPVAGYIRRMQLYGGDPNDPTAT